MKVLLGRLLVLFFVATSLWVAVKDQTLFSVQDIKVSVEMSGTEKSAWLELNQQIEKDLKVYQGSPLWRVSLADVKQKLLSYPLLKDLQVQKSWPHTLEVSYSLPSLKAIYQTPDGHYKILAEDGQWVGPVKWSRLPGLPWMKGDWLHRKPELKSNLLELFKQLPRQGTFSAEQISEIQFNDMDGFLLTLIKSGQQIRFGFENFELKSLRVAQVLDYLQLRGLESRVIDANFSKKVLVRLRNHP